MQTQNNNSIFTIIGVKNDGKTTIGKYIIEVINKPTIIIDIAEQFDDKKSYQRKVKGLTELKFYLENKSFRSAFIKAKQTIIYRFNTQDKAKEAEKVFQYINDSIRNITIFCEELELYADNYLNRRSPIFETMYLSRNKGYTIINVVKEISMLSKLIKSATDFFILGRIRDLNAQKYFNERSLKRFEKEIKDLKHRQFLITDLVDFWEVFQLKEKMFNIINK